MSLKIQILIKLERNLNNSKINVNNMKDFTI